MIPFLAHLLFVLAAWTLTIKYAFPVCFAWWEGSPLLEHVYWDFWWVVHIWLGWSLLHWRAYTLALALAVSVTEIIIIVVKFVLFLDEPQWTMWTTNWFINKFFVLACFTLMLAHLARNGRRIQAERGALGAGASAG